MLEEDFLEIVNGALRPLGAVPEPGESFASPPLDILQLVARPVRLHWMPVVGRALSVVAIARQPVDLAFSAEGARHVLRRLAMAVNGRFPPRLGSRSGGLSIGLTAVVLTPEPIEPGDEATLQAALTGLARMRAVPLGFIRVNLGQEAVAFALGRGPGNLFPEPTTLADVLCEHLRRFVPLI